jgi:hypothetical protein
MNMATEKKAGFEFVSTSESPPTITIEGWDSKDQDLANLLEKAADFLRSSGKTTKAGQEMTFKQLDTGSLFVIAHRS